MPPLFNIQNLCGNGGSGSGGQSSQSSVESVNGVLPGANGNVQLDAERNLGAALMALNWSSYTRRYARYVAEAQSAAASEEEESEEEEEGETPVIMTPEEYLMAFTTNGCRFVRTASGLHFGVTAVIASGLIARGYIFLPSDTTADCKAIAKIGNTEMLSFSGTIDGLEAEICGLPIATRLWVRNNTGWVDVADGWQTDGDYTADASCKSSFVKTYLWTLPPGRYMLRLTDGIVYLQAIRAASNTVRYRMYRIYPNSGNGLLTALYDNSTEVWARGIDVSGAAFYRFGGSSLATQAWVNTGLAGKTSADDARAIANAQILSEVTQPFNDALVNVRIQKFTKINETATPGEFDPGRRCLRLDIENAEWLVNKWSSIESCELHLMICSRKRGRGYHWWHPRNHNFVPEEGEAKGNKIGYGVIAGKKTNRTDETEEFPSVPGWMPNNGFMQTEIAVTRADLQKGYVLLYPDEYFLPMLKPKSVAAISTAGQWQRNIAIIGTENKNPHPLLCGWVLAVNGVALGLPQQEYRFGCTRHQDQSQNTAVAVSGNSAKITNFYSSISNK